MTIIDFKSFESQPLWILPESLPWNDTQQLTANAVQWFNSVLWNIDWIETRVSQSETDINLRVRQDNVINEINLSTEWIDISWNRIAISWNTTFASWYDPTTKATTADLWSLAFIDSVSNNQISSNAISTAKLDSTIISWWLLRTTLIDVNSIFASNITASNTITWTTIQTWSWSQDYLILWWNDLRFYNNGSFNWRFASWTIIDLSFNWVLFDWDFWVTNNLFVADRLYLNKGSWNWIYFWTWWARLGVSNNWNALNFTSESWTTTTLVSTP